MEQRAVSVRVTSDGYVVSCPGTEVVGRGPTETDAWLDFWDAVRDDWELPGQRSVAPLGGRLPARRWMRVRTIRVRDLFG
ncbi:hypothetical protein [Streptomyces sp. NPDC057909]|uniref:hypothetical protein n=1 Tax=Streptomyces sp. NPDC057909 TaxID=3346277 RepID=UPI0036E575A9